MALKSKPLDQVRATVPVAAAAQEEIVRVNLNVPKSTRIAWKTAALRRGMTLAELVNQAMNKYSNE
jgi:hypothetical protein